MVDHRLEANVPTRGQTVEEDIVFQYVQCSVVQCKQAKPKAIHIATYVKMRPQRLTFLHIHMQSARGVSARVWGVPFTRGEGCVL